MLVACSKRYMMNKSIIAIVLASLALNCNREVPDVSAASASPHVVPSASVEHASTPAVTVEPASVSNRPVQCHTSEGKRRLPDPELTPGKLCTAQDLDFDGYRYPSKIPYCRRRVTEKMKMTVASSYGIPKEDWNKYEFDHYIPLSAGGANDVTNIWPQPLDDAKDKDVVEVQVYRGLKSGEMTQPIALAKIRSWKPTGCKLRTQ